LVTKLLDILKDHLAKKGGLVEAVIDEQCLDGVRDAVSSAEDIHGERRAGLAARWDERRFIASSCGWHSDTIRAGRKAGEALEYHGDGGLGGGWCRRRVDLLNLGTSLFEKRVLLDRRILLPGYHVKELVMWWFVKSRSRWGIILELQLAEEEGIGEDGTYQC
jgi:hypothetical protein